MSSQKSVLKQILSRLKNALLSRDMQDIYRSTSTEFSAQSKRPDASAPSLITYKIYEDDNVLALMEQVCPQGEQERQFVHQRLGKGDKAVIGSLEGQPVFYGWLMFNEIEVTYGVFMPLGARTAFGYNLYTRSSHRRMGVMSGFYGFARSYLHQRRFDTLYVGISSQNEPSIKAHEKNGFRKEGYFYTLKMLGTCYTLARFPGIKRFFLHSPQ
ncbi:MAG: GNAT family N-acetyltransferase [Hyphomicrobiaceae bacterium]|nr:GNAT family N-acetyltransferase [Hyphomicrobiaceae bacterium]